MKKLNVFHKLKRVYKQSLYMVSALVLAVSVLAQTPFPAFATPTFTEYPLTTGYKGAGQIVSAGGSVWYMNANGSNIPHLSNISSSGVITDYSLLPSGDTSVTFTSRSLNVDSTGKLWVAGCVITAAGYGSQQLLLGRMDPSTATLTFFHYPSFTCKGFSSFDWSISNSAIDANDNIWVSMHRNGYSGYTRLVQFNNSGTYQYGYSPNTAVRNWTDFTAGPNNSLWIADTRNNKITQLTLDPTTSAVTGSTSYVLTFTPGGISAGPDGNLWFSGAGVSNKMDTSGTLTQYTPPAGYVPSRFTTGPDGALWLALNSSTLTGKIARMDAATGTITSSYAAPSTGASVGNITAGPDGALWFVEQISSSAWKIVKMDITPSNQTVSFTSTAPTHAVVSGSKYTPTASATSDLSVAVTVDSSSASVCTIVSGVVSFQGAGTCTLNANQGGDFDYNPAPQVQQAFTVYPVDADLSVSLDCPATASISATVECTITIENDGPAAAENVSLTTLFTNSFTGASLSGGGTLSGQSITWSTASLDPYDPVTLTFNATAALASKTSFSAAVLQTNPDPAISNNIAQATIVISQ